MIEKRLAMRLVPNTPSFLTLSLSLSLARQVAWARMSKGSLERVDLRRPTWPLVWLAISVRRT